MVQVSTGQSSCHRKPHTRLTTSCNYYLIASVAGIALSREPTSPFASLSLIKVPIKSSHNALVSTLTSSCSTIWVPTCFVAFFAYMHCILAYCQDTLLPSSFMKTPFTYKSYIACFCIFLHFLSPFYWGVTRKWWLEIFMSCATLNLHQKKKYSKWKILEAMVHKEKICCIYWVHKLK